MTSRIPPSSTALSPTPDLPTRSDTPSSSPTPSPTPVLPPPLRRSVVVSHAGSEPPQLGGAGAFDVLVAEFVQSQHLFREFLPDAERIQHSAEAANAELRGELALARQELALVRAQALPARRAPTGKPAPAKKPARKKPSSGAAVGAHGGAAREPSGASRAGKTDPRNAGGRATPTAFGGSHGRPQVMGGGTPTLRTSLTLPPRPLRPLRPPPARTSTVLRCPPGDSPSTSKAPALERAQRRPKPFPSPVLAPRLQLLNPLRPRRVPRPLRKSTRPPSRASPRGSPARNSSTLARRHPQCSTAAAPRPRARAPHRPRGGMAEAEAAPAP
mmetsp:Transcript_70949/g.160558  ORF Transcript_70949/g.160558 Transcript_70949/m.160558 type:complete len:329 (+) Transcript_70949:287-1273(+)